MTRTNAREIALHFMFELAFSSHNAESLLKERLTKEHFSSLKEECYLYFQFPSKKQADYIQTLVEGAYLHSPELDDYISRYAKGWSFTRIPRAIAALMRIAMFEVLYMPDIPDSAAINDALEIAKGYDDPEVISFMNGILGSFVRTEVAQIPNRPVKPATLVEEVFDLTEETPEKETSTETEPPAEAEGEEA